MPNPDPHEAEAERLLPCLRDHPCDNEDRRLGLLCQRCQDRPAIAEALRKRDAEIAVLREQNFAMNKTIASKRALLSRAARALGPVKLAAERANRVKPWLPDSVPYSCDGLSLGDIREAASTLAAIRECVKEEK